MDSVAEPYETLLKRKDHEDYLDEEDEEHFLRSSTKRILNKIQYYLSGVLVCSLLVNVTLSVYILQSVKKTAEHNIPFPGRLYTPAQDAISYNLVKFDSGIYGGETPYQGYPTPENNALWEELYEHETSHISPEVAKILPNRTSAEAPYEGSGYLVVLNVFHNLHCIDSIRQSWYYFLDPKWNATLNPYTLHPEDPELGLQILGGRDVGTVHVDHCLDALRQSVMCEGDTTPNVFQYSEKHREIRAWATVVHECRDSNKIKFWAREHRATAFQGFDEQAPELGKCGDTSLD
ncbi:hypothetical protein F5884DRAFT_884330 [Xylogone sp. PMI_703]|nr:hypothetical protein F5884DRAFT_884330 [Xylogone sp. PMI_703]